VNVGPYRVRVPEDILKDLHARLARIRWPDEVEDAGWDYGVPLAYMRELVEYWREKFDWQGRRSASTPSITFAPRSAG
jgi:hypothetical protein